MHPDEPSKQPRARSGPWIARLVDVRAPETRALCWSCAWFFCVLTGYSILRPLREQMGLAGGKQNLPWLFTGTMVGMFVANPIFAVLVSRTRRRTFIPWVYRFLGANLLVFFVLLRELPEERAALVSRIFFVWVSVTNLFAISLFWSLMADVWHLEQGKRLFGFIAVGGTLGAIAGAAVTATFVRLIGPAYLLLVSIAFLEIGVQCVYRLVHLASARDAAPAPAESIDPAPAQPGVTLALAAEAAEIAGSDPEREEAVALAQASARKQPLHDALNGIRLVLRSSYLRTICMFTFCYTLSTTFVYFLQAHIVDAAITDRAAQAAWFGQIDLAVNILTALAQIFVTGRLVAAIGIGPSLILQPLLAVAAFACLGFSPVLAVLAVFQVLLRSVHFATAKPAREMLFTVVGRDVKYKAKSFIDTFVYRGGDTLGAWAFDYQQSRLGLGLNHIAFIGAPVAIAWALVGVHLGRKQDELARAHASTAQANTSALSGSR